VSIPTHYQPITENTDTFDVVVDTHTLVADSNWEVLFRFAGKLDRMTTKLELPKTLVPTRRIIMTKQRLARTKKACLKISAWRPVLTAIILALPMRAYTQDPPAPPDVPVRGAMRMPGTAAKPGAVIEQQALDDLKRMSTALSAAKAFTCKTRSTVEIPSRETGQFITLMGNTDVAVQRPNKLRVQVAGEVPNFDFYYDGTNIAAYAPQNKVYSISQAPGTIDEMFKILEGKTGIQLPAADMLNSDPYAELTKGLTSAFVVGKSTVDGVACEHVACMSPGVNWEVWIDAGKSALPQRMAVTYANVRNFPRRLVEFSNWNTQPTLSDNDFVFQKPADAKQIDFLSPVNPVPTGRQKGR
jgi:hypothetical protein